MQVSDSDLEFLENVGVWPKSRDGVSYCCLIRGTGNDREFGFILGCDVSAESVVVGLGNVFDGGSGETVAYGSFRDVCLDGWRVD